MLTSQVKVAFKTYFSKIPAMFLWRQQALGEGFERRVQEETLRDLFYIQIPRLILFYAALL